MVDPRAEDLPRVLANTSALARDAEGQGAVWRLAADERDLDANVIALGPGGSIGEHAGPDLDVILHVVSGSGILTTAGGDVALEPGGIVWLPRRTRRGFTAGAEGLVYFSVHRRKPGLGLSARPTG
ncbi:cupin domain-containing protein [Sinomonas mesophila]|uniref:cupin domain-containing protein n=1 Tax=Sinomonas mesophila TaxID=1531955 RepID=UPI0009862B0A|nr:cupin domain-containing protein [Sinomonas mesophila]